MKNVIFVILIVIAMPQMSCSSANPIAKTSKAFDSNKPEIKNFTVKYTSQDNLEWSQDLGEATNGCMDTSGSTETQDLRFCTYTSDHRVVVADSSAAKICMTLTSDDGVEVRLPTREEFENLIREFDHTESAKYGPILTDSGIEQLNIKLDDLLFDRINATSSVFVATIVNEKGDIISQADAVYIFTLGKVSKYYMNRIIPQRVRCVRAATH